MEDMDTKEIKVKPGGKVSLFGRLCHIIAINDDEGESIVTYKRWMSGKKEWRYAAELLWVMKQWGEPTD